MIADENLKALAEIEKKLPKPDDRRFTACLISQLVLALMIAPDSWHLEETAGEIQKCLALFAALMASHLPSDIWRLAVDQAYVNYLKWEEKSSGGAVQ